MDDIFIDKNINNGKEVLSCNLIESMNHKCKEKFKKWYKINSNIIYDEVYNINIYLKYYFVYLKLNCNFTINDLILIARSFKFTEIQYDTEKVLDVCIEKQNENENENENEYIDNTNNINSVYVRNEHHTIKNKLKIFLKYKTTYCQINKNGLLVLRSSLTIRKTLRYLIKILKKIKYNTFWKYEDDNISINIENEKKKCIDNNERKINEYGNTKKRKSNKNGKKKEENENENKNGKKKEENENEYEYLNDVYIKKNNVFSMENILEKENKMYITQTKDTNVKNYFHCKNNIQNNKEIENMYEEHTNDENINENIQQIRIENDQIKKDEIHKKFNKKYIYKCDTYRKWKYIIREDIKIDMDNFIIKHMISVFNIKLKYFDIPKFYKYKEFKNIITDIKNIIYLKINSNFLLYLLSQLDINKNKYKTKINNENITDNLDNPLYENFNKSVRTALLYSTGNVIIYSCLSINEILSITRFIITALKNNDNIILN